jgi:hypothetical protein
MKFEVWSKKKQIIRIEREKRERKEKKKIGK